ncbi:MAG: YlxR family protein [Lachnospiraceae bacterium]|nr:YlxR family protein [Lachnospiraceae bacterium]
MDTQKKRPQRTCLGCRETKNKELLTRIVRTPEGTVELDPTGRKNGRGAYLCPDVKCLKKALKSKALSRALKTEIPEETTAALEEEITRE